MNGPIDLFFNLDYIQSFNKGINDSSNVTFLTIGLSKLGIPDKVLEGAEKAGLAVNVYDRVAEDPPESVIVDLINYVKVFAVTLSIIHRNLNFMKAKGADGVVGVGGGSSMDAAKVAAFMCGDTKQQLSEVYGVGLTVGRRLPLIQVGVNSTVKADI